jgi:hypothetical protein
MLIIKSLFFSAFLLIMQRAYSFDINIDPTSCAGGGGDVIRAALSEVTQMVQIAYFCTKNLMEIGNYPECNNRVVMRTYQAYFGGIIEGYFGQTGQMVKGTHLLHFYYTKLLLSIIHDTTRF